MNKINDTNFELNKLFKKGKVIGIGGFGKVWCVNHIYTQKPYAMKEISKIKVVSKKSAISVINERNLLAHLKNDFLINMHHAFQTKECLYLTMDLVTGGDLRLHISRRRYFAEEEVKFMAACIILSLE
jgi:serine/threonine protein kinase